MVTVTSPGPPARVDEKEIANPIRKFDPIPDGGEPTGPVPRREHRRTPDPVSTVAVDGYDFHYVEAGEGDPVVLVHGSLTDYRTWDHQLDAFSEDLRVVAYSRRYHYPNAVWTDSDPEYSVPLHASDLLEIVETLDVAPVTLVGLSYGGFTCLCAAMERPDLVDRVVLAEPPVVPLLVSDMGDPLDVLGLLVRDLSTGLSLLKFGIRAYKSAQNALEEGDLEEGVRRFTNGVLGDGAYGELPREMREQYLANGPALKAELLGPGFPDFSTAAAGRVAVPVMLLSGEESPKFFRSISDTLAEILPESQQRVVAGASHGMHLDDPDEFNRICRRFILE